MCHMSRYDARQTPIISVSVPFQLSFILTVFHSIYTILQAKLAQYYGCSGLIIYSDPAEFAPKGGPPVYPNGPNLPPGGVQRGSLLISSGDPLTPGIPAIR